MKNDVIIIGAGIGGMNAAMQLASNGYSVTILEKRSEPGGKMRRVFHGDCLFDAGPSLITMPFILRDAFAQTGAVLDEYLKLLPIDPICHYRWLDGKQYDCHSNPFKRNEETEKIFGRKSMRFITQQKMCFSSIHLMDSKNFSKGKISRFCLLFLH